MFTYIDYMRAWVGTHVRNERGAVATEYAVLVAFLVVLIVAGAALFGGALRDWLSGLVGDVQGADTSAPGGGDGS